MNLYSIQSQFAALDAMLEETQGVITPEIETYKTAGVEVRGVEYIREPNVRVS